MSIDDNTEKRADPQRYRKTPPPRHDLLNRRLTETRSIATPHAIKKKIYLSVGFDPDEPDRPREVFYSEGFKSGSQMEFQVLDACVMISLLLQHGLKPQDIAKSLSRVEQPDGSVIYASIVGQIAKELVT